MWSLNSLEFGWGRKPRMKQTACTDVHDVRQSSSCWLSWELHPQAQWATGQLLQEALSLHWDMASRFSVSGKASYRKPGWETTGKVKGVYVHNTGSCVRTGKNPVPDLWSALLDRSALVLEHSRGQLGSRGYLARDFLCFKEKEVPYFLAESPSSKNKTKPRWLPEHWAAGNLYSKSLRYDFRRCSEYRGWGNKCHNLSLAKMWQVYINTNSKAMSWSAILLHKAFVQLSTQSCPDLRTQHKSRILHWLWTPFSLPMKICDSAPCLPSL